MAYFAQFVAGITKNFTENLVELATGDMYISSQIDNSTEQSIFDREYEYLRMSESFLADLSDMQEVTEVNHRIEIPVRFNLPDDTVTFQLSAFNIETEQRLKNNFTIVEGRMIENNAFEIILPADFARPQQHCSRRYCAIACRYSEAKSQPDDLQGGWNIYNSEFIRLV